MLAQVFAAVWLTERISLKMKGGIPKTYLFIERLEDTRQVSC